MSVDKVYIVLLNYNGWKDTIECLESVLKSDYLKYQIIVVDNNSTNDSMKNILAWAEGKQDLLYKDSKLEHLSQPVLAKPLEYVYYDNYESISDEEIKEEKSLSNPIIFIQSDLNGGFSAGNNLGIRYALMKNDFDYIWLLNNDTVIKEDSLSQLVRYATSYEVGITGSALFYYSNPNKIQTYGGYIDKFLGTGKHITEKDNLNKLEYIIGASLLIDKKVVEKIGLLPEEYFLYYEDTDFCYTASKQGFTLATAVDSVVYHKEGGSTGASNSISQKSAFADYHSFKSRKIFQKKHFPNMYGLIYLQLVIYVIHRLLFGKFENAASLIKAFRDK